MKLYSKTLNKGYSNESVVSMHVENDTYCVKRNWTDGNFTKLYYGKDSVQATSIYENSVTWN